MMPENKSKYFALLPLFLPFFLAGCFASVDSNTRNTLSESDDSETGLVVTNVPKDGIPSLDHPDFTSMDNIEYLEESDLMLGIKVGDRIKGYPHMVLDRHEVVNDVVEDMPVAVTYCPLTGTGIAWHRNIDGTVTEFGVSGLLLKNNLVPYDRKTDSNWSQMRLEGLGGVHENEDLEYIQLIEATWGTWKKLFSESQILDLSEGAIAYYQEDAYGNYEEDHDLILFPVDNENNTIKNKERIHGITTGGKAMAYVLSGLPEEDFVNHTQIGDTPIVMWGSSALNLLVSFKNRLNNGTNPEMQKIERDGSVIMKDQLDNYYDVFGNVVEGPNKGQKLEKVTSYNAYWFAWADFFSRTGLRFATTINPR